MRETKKQIDLGGINRTQSSSKEVQIYSNAEKSGIKAIQITSKASRSRLNAVSEMPEEIDRAIKSLLYDDQESDALENTSDHIAGEVDPIFYPEERFLPRSKQIVEERSTDSQSEEQSIEVEQDPHPHESSSEEIVEKDPESRIKDMLAEAEKLSKMMEREKKKMRRLHQENETLDRELELIKEKLK